MKPNPPGYMTTPKERKSYWTYFVGQNAYYYITASFISTYLAMQGIDLTKVALVLLIVKIWDAINDPLFGFLFDRIEFKSGQKSLPWLRVSTALMPIVTIAIFSIPGVRGIEFGDGFKAAAMKGSEHNDPFGPDGIPTKNGAGGINGGISNGMPIVFRVAFKPTASIAKKQHTWNFVSDKMTQLSIPGRHDVCFALRCPVIVEAMAAIVLADQLV